MPLKSNHGQLPAWRVRCEWPATDYRRATRESFVGFSEPTRLECSHLEANGPGLRATYYCNKVVGACQDTEQVTLNGSRLRFHRSNECRFPVIRALPISAARVLRVLTAPSQTPHLNVIMSSVRRLTDPV